MSRLVVLAALAACAAEPSSIAIDRDTDVVYAEPGSVIEVDGLQLTVPAETGAGVGIAVELADGFLQIAVENQGGGLVAIRTNALDVANRSPTAITDIGVINRNPACSDTTYKLEGHRWASPLRWSLSTANNPTSEMEAMIRLGARNVVSSHNDCGLVDLVDATEQYLGRTADPAPGGSGGTCPARDSKSIVGFGALSGTFKAYTCWYWDATSFLVEADIRFKLDESWLTTTAVPTDCVERLHLASVATHEFGHAFGLLHPVGDHPVLTMQPGGPCDASKASLALGDVNGLRALY